MGLIVADSEKAFGTGKLEMKKPSQALLLQIVRERNTVGWSKGCVKGTGLGRAT